MPSITLIAAGRLKSGPMRQAFDEYRKRLKWTLTLQEIDIRDGGPRQKDLENRAILEALSPNTPLFVLDERGKSFSSPGFAKLLQAQFDQTGPQIQFVIGGADGLSDDIRARARHIVNFGEMTWPHMMARVMLAEQLYRAQQILAGHPYHRGD